MHPDRVRIVPGGHGPTVGPIAVGFRPAGVSVTGGGGVTVTARGGGTGGASVTGLTGARGVCRFGNGAVKAGNPGTPGFAVLGAVGRGASPVPGNITGGFGFGRVAAGAGFGEDGAADGR
jgi:hypothetical protein